MRMLRSDTALEELMSRVLGDLLKEAIADGLYCCRNSRINSYRTGGKSHRSCTSVILAFPHPKRSSTLSPQPYYAEFGTLSL